jgi:hypothetical protein
VARPRFGRDDKGRGGTCPAGDNGVHFTYPLLHDSCFFPWLDWRERWLLAFRITSPSVEIVGSPSLLRTATRRFIEICGPGRRARPGSRLVVLSNAQSCSPHSHARASGCSGARGQGGASVLHQLRQRPRTMHGAPLSEPFRVGGHGRTASDI